MSPAASAGRTGEAATAASPARTERRDHAPRGEMPEVMGVLAGRSETDWPQRMAIPRRTESRPGRAARPAAIAASRQRRRAHAKSKAKSTWHRRNLALSLGPPDFRVATARTLHARHAASDYDERAVGAIAILGVVDECLLTERARRFTRPDTLLQRRFAARGRLASPEHGSELAQTCWQHLVEDRRRPRALELRGP